MIWRVEGDSLSLNSSCYISKVYWGESLIEWDDSGIFNDSKIIIVDSDSKRFDGFDLGGAYL
jgi:hypothetical protein